MSLSVAENLVVSINYTLTDDEGNVIDSSEGSDLLTYLHGAGNIIPGLENELTGKTEGDSLQVKVQPSDGYGEQRQELIQIVDKAVFQGTETLEPGMSFQAQGPDGMVQNIVIKEINDEEVTIDANHPLAWTVLNFEVQVIMIREATKEEIDHGHVH